MTVSPHDPTGAGNPADDRLDDLLRAIAGGNFDGAVDPPELPSTFLMPAGAADENPLPSPLAASTPEPRVELGQYDLLELLGEGAWGVVWRAFDRALRRTVAIKILKPQPAQSPEAVARFLAEARMAGRLQHAGIAPVHAAGYLPDGRPAIVMKLVEGRTLQQLLKERIWPERDLGRFLDYFQQICRTLVYTHTEHALLHRDLKPANVMVDLGGAVQVMDWGLGKMLAAEAETPSAISPAQPSGTERDSILLSHGGTAAGAMVGTPSFMSPEQAQGRIDEISTRSDLFCLGGILAQILTNEPTYTGSQRAVVLQQAQTGDLSACFQRLQMEEQIDPTLTPLTDLARWCLAPQPQHRPARAEEIVERITAYHNGIQERLRQEALAGATFRWRVSLALAVLVLIVFVTGAGAWYQMDRAARNRIIAARNAVTRETLDSMNQDLLEERYELAQRSFDRIADRASDPTTSSDLRLRLETAAADFRFLAAFEQARLNFARLTDTMSSNEGTFLEYAEAFRDYGLDFERREESIQQIRQSPIRSVLLAALDHWALTADQPLAGAITKIASAVREGEEGSAGNFQTLSALSTADLSQRWMEMSAVEFESLGRRLLQMEKAGKTQQVKENPPGAEPARDADSLTSEQVLRQGVARFPGDFWLNLLLAQSLSGDHLSRISAAERRTRFNETVGYLRAAHALRPDSVFAKVALARAVIEAGGFDEAEALLRGVLARQPRFLLAHLLRTENALRRGDRLAAEASHRQMRQLLASPTLLEKDRRVWQVQVEEQAERIRQIRN